MSQAKLSHRLSDIVKWEIRNVNKKNQVNFKNKRWLFFEKGVVHD